MDDGKENPGARGSEAGAGQENRRYPVYAALRPEAQPVVRIVARRLPWPSVAERGTAVDGSGGGYPPADPSGLPVTGLAGGAA